jgi:hypothetical protein
MEHGKSELTRIEPQLCRTCRNLNLRIETFVQTGWRYPTTLAYETVQDLFDRLDGFQPKETHYVEGERLEEHQDYEDWELARRLRSVALEWNECSGRPYPPNKLKGLGTLEDVATRAARGCSLCQLVVHVAADTQSTCLRQLTNAGKALKPQDECRLRFDFKDIEHHINIGGEEGTKKSEPQPPQDCGYYECFLSIGRDLKLPIYPLMRQADMMWFGGRLFRSEIDYSLINRWMDSCEKLHTTCSRQKHRVDTRTVSSLRVIDVRSNCLTTISVQGTRFVALSYVWGSVPMFVTKEDKLRALSTPGGLNRWMHEIPNTIRDAMHVVRKLGLYYLWTDSICIVQDDEAELAHLIRRMDMIYASAYLTIVAAEGSDANAGLRGAHSGIPRETPRFFPCAQDFDLFAAPNTLHGTLLSGVWSTRAWTLQEALLSSRLLIFTNGAMHFTCGSLSWSEDLKAVSETTAPPWKQVNENAFHFRARLTAEDRMAKPTVGTMWFLELWMQMVMDLSERKLKMETDVLFAAAGLIAQLETFYQTRSLYGLPEYHLEEFLSWSPAVPGSLYRRRDPSRAPFNPTWSWSGWDGEVSWPGGDAESVKLEGTSVFIRKLQRLDDQPVPLQTGYSSPKDTTAKSAAIDFPFLEISTQTAEFRISKTLLVPDWARELQPFAWYTFTPDGVARNGVYCIYSRQELSDPVGSIVLDSKEDCNFDHTIYCDFINISSYPQRLDVGDYAGQVFFNVLAIRRMMIAGKEVTERIGHGRILLEKSKGCWRHETILLR